ncbi:MAG: hypothetical protein ACRDU4_07115, partial [Mycobacterium sp.]
MTFVGAIDGLAGVTFIVCGIVILFAQNQPSIGAVAGTLMIIGVAFALLTFVRGIQILRAKP